MDKIEEKLKIVAAAVLDLGRTGHLRKITIEADAESKDLGPMVIKVTTEQIIWPDNDHSTIPDYETSEYIVNKIKK